MRNDVHELDEVIQAGKEHHEDDDQQIRVRELHQQLQKVDYS